MPNEHFCLKWNNFQRNIVAALGNLKLDEDFVDVTISCEGKLIKAHKVILSACSDYFRDLFRVSLSSSFLRLSNFFVAWHDNQEEEQEKALTIFPVVMSCPCIIKLVCTHGTHHSFHRDLWTDLRGLWRVKIVTLALSLFWPHFRPQKRRGRDLKAFWAA